MWFIDLSACPQVCVRVCCWTYYISVLVYIHEYTYHASVISPTTEFHVTMLIIEWKPCNINFTSWFENTCLCVWNLITKIQRQKSNQFFLSRWKHYNKQLSKNKQTTTIAEMMMIEWGAYLNWGNEPILNEVKSAFRIIIVCIQVERKNGKKRDVSLDESIDWFLIETRLKCTLTGLYQLVCD